MSDFKILKCPACGSSNVETQSETLLSCSHCGSNFVSKTSIQNQTKSPGSKLKLILLIAMPVILTFIAINNWIPKDNTIPPNSKPEVVKSSQENSNQFVKVPVTSMPTFNTKQNEIIQVNLEEGTEKFQQTDDSNKNPLITIINNVPGETSLGGKFWIVTVRNDSNAKVTRPSVVVSLFDQDNRRIAEQSGYSKLDVLEENQETVILVLISNPPTVSYTSQFQAKAALPNPFGNHVIAVNVDDFTLVADGNSKKMLNIIGDVSNPNDYRVDFIRVQAIGKNKQGIAVALADAFITNPSLGQGEISGFKISAGTFVAQPVDSWTLWAGGSKHRDN